MAETAQFADDVAAALRDACAAAAPREFVGLLGGRRAGATWRVEALALVPNGAAATDAFAVAPADFAAAEAALRAAGHDWLGFAHGHPRAEATPSARDRAAFWPDCLQAIVGGEACAELRVFWRDAGGCRELACVAAEAL